MDSQKICFVVMGFGKKKDPESNRTIDLDETYKKIIKPAVEACNYRCVRADEILDSGIIDRSMYALLYRADLVIADISTLNPNAIYELGARHVLKRNSTIVIKEGDGGLPFDISHNRVSFYSHSKEEISDEEIVGCVEKLKALINSVTNNIQIDSPLYSYIPKTKRPIIRKRVLRKIIKIPKKMNTLSGLSEKAKEHMSKSEFTEAAKIWHELGEKVKDDIYYIQQEALCTYKSERPNKKQALTNALFIIGKIRNQTDTETLGISGAINKGLWGELNEESYLDEAIKCYKNGWILHKDYYTGDNYAFCLEQKSIIERDTREKIYFEVEAKKTREETIKVIFEALDKADSERVKWMYSTLSNCYLSLGDNERAKGYENKFRDQKPQEWEIETFESAQKDILSYVKQKE